MEGRSIRGAAAALSISICLRRHFHRRGQAMWIFWLPMLTAKRLRKILSYAPTTGIFRWQVSAGSRAPVGAIAGTKNGRGYHQIRIGGRPYSASRLAWLYMTDKWPNSEISYINGKPSDTRWANLREATSLQNRSRPKKK